MGETAMPSTLVTGGTVFVSRYIAEFYVAKGWDVYVLNRNSREQSKGVKLIEADRHQLGETLRPYHFDVVVDTAYNANDVEHLLDALGSYGDYVLISSSAVYPDHAVQPLREDTPVGMNRYWGKYGTDKIEAEAAALKRKPDAYFLRPCYIYGPMNNVHREALVFECALAGRKFYVPGAGEQKLQFIHIHDLCRLIDAVLETRPQQHVFNAGNKESISVRDWVELCYRVAGKEADIVNVSADVEQRKYFSFYPYEYELDVSAQYELLKEMRPFEQGLKESFAWYVDNTDKIMRRSYLDFIDQELA